MSNLYDQLLEAAIQHLEELRARGIRFVSVSQEALAEFGQMRERSPMKAPSPGARALQRSMEKPPVQLTPPAPPKPMTQTSLPEEALSLTLPGEAVSAAAAPRPTP